MGYLERVSLWACYPNMKVDESKVRFWAKKEGL